METRNESMIFPTFEFFAFFAVALALNWFLKRWPLAWRLFLLIASYYFYSVWDVRLLLVLFFLSLFNFASGYAIFRNYLQERKFILILTVVCDLGTLAVFKYYDFFRQSAESLLGRLGFFADMPLLEIILPIGLSFYLFKIISFVADVYLGKIESYPGFLDFAIYVSFFPQLLSGPISRGREFFPQLAAGGAEKIDRPYYYFTLIMLGLFKKICLSSYLVLNLTDDAFAVPGNHSSLIILMAVFAYSLVIYFDLSSYSDMAIGFAGLMGFRLPANFDAPYLARNIQDFWRRWHISLSAWIRDYIYIPLGGNRKGEARKCANLMIAMIVMGLWHGSAGHYLFWGGFQGLGLAAHQAYRTRTRGKMIFGRSGGSRIGKTAAWLLTFLFITAGWVFFRSESVADAFTIFSRVIHPVSVSEPVQLYLFLAIGTGFLLLAFEKQIIDNLCRLQERLPVSVWCFLLSALAISIFKLGPDTLPAFIYFSF